MVDDGNKLATLVLLLRESSEQTCCGRVVALTHDNRTVIVEQSGGRVGTDKVLVDERSIGGVWSM